MASLVSATEQKKVRSVCQDFALGYGKYCRGFITFPLCGEQECVFKHFAVFCAFYITKQTSGLQISSMMMMMMMMMMMIIIITTLQHMQGNRCTIGQKTLL
jgi:hypothetical protein